MLKLCNKCNQNIDLSFFDKGRAVCKKCRQNQKTIWKKLNYKKNPSKYKEYAKVFYDKNKEEVLKKTNNYKTANKEKISNRNKKYYQSHKDFILEINKKYRINNKQNISIKINNWKKLQRKNNICFKLRENVSRSIRNFLFKNKQSFLKYLSYSIQDLKQHIECQFEPWMTWNNYGSYRKENWNDNNSSTWTWQIDHIIPHSEFNYTNMEDEEFKKCWSLENLRPYSSKQNLLDGISKIRHKKVV